MSHTKEIDQQFHAEEITAITDKLLLLSDALLPIFCEGWPTCAKELITRKRLCPDSLIMSLTEKINLLCLLHSNRNLT